MEKEVADHAQKCSEKHGFIGSRAFPYLYLLPKLHKLDLHRAKTRTIAGKSRANVPCGEVPPPADSKAPSGTALSPMSDFLAKALNSWIDFLVLRDTKSKIKRCWVVRTVEEFIDVYGQLPNTVKSIGTFDATTMYTKLKHDDILSAVKFTAGEIAGILAHRYGCSEEDARTKISFTPAGTWQYWPRARARVPHCLDHVCEMLHDLLQFTHIRAFDLFVRQIVGLFMGNECSPPLATICLYHKECKFVEKKLEELGEAEVLKRFHGFRFHLRFIDDLLAPTSNIEDIPDYGIEFVKTSKSDTSVTFLGVETTLHPDEPIFKAMDKQHSFKFIITRFPSFHSSIPRTIRIGTVIGMLVRSLRLTSETDHFINESEFLLRLFIDRGYGPGDLREAVAKFGTRHVHPRWSVSVKDRLRRVIDKLFTPDEQTTSTSTNTTTKAQQVQSAQAKNGKDSLPTPSLQTAASDAAEVGREKSPPEDRQKHLVHLGRKLRGEPSKTPPPEPVQQPLSDKLWIGKENKPKPKQTNPEPAPSTGAKLRLRRDRPDVDNSSTQTGRNPILVDSATCTDRSVQVRSQAISTSPIDSSVVEISQPAADPAPSKQSKSAQESTALALPQNQVALAPCPDSTNAGIVSPQECFTGASSHQVYAPHVHNEQRHDNPVTNYATNYYITNNVVQAVPSAFAYPGQPEHPGMDWLQPLPPAAPSPQALPTTYQPPLLEASPQSDESVVILAPPGNEREDVQLAICDKPSQEDSTSHSPHERYDPFRPKNYIEKDPWKGIVPSELLRPPPDLSSTPDVVTAATPKPSTPPQTLLEVRQNGRSPSPDPVEPASVPLPDEASVAAPSVVVISPTEADQNNTPPTQRVTAGDLRKHQPKRKASKRLRDHLLGADVGDLVHIRYCLTSDLRRRPNDAPCFTQAGILRLLTDKEFCLQTSKTDPSKIFNFNHATYTLLDYKMDAPV